MRELVDLRSATSDTWENSDGSRTVRQYSEPRYFKDGGNDWQPIDLSLEQVDPRDDSGAVWQTVAAPQPVAFAALGATGGTERLHLSGHSVTISPENVSGDQATPEVSDRTAEYNDLWPSVSAVYDVGSTGVREDLILSDRNAATSFSFAVDGASITATDDGGALISVDGVVVGLMPAPIVSIASPTTLARGQAPLDGSASTTELSKARLIASGDRLTITVSPDWLRNLPDSAFPVDIDPSVYYPGTATSTRSYASNGDQINGTMLVGADSLARMWRSTTYFSTPAPPAASPPYYLTKATVTGYCSPSCGPVPAPYLKSVYVEGFTGSLSNPPSYSKISDSSFTHGLGYVDGTSIVVDVTSWWRGRSGAWIDLYGNDNYPNYPNDPASQRVASFPDAGGYFYMSFDYYQNTPPSAITSFANNAVLSTTTPVLTAAPVTVSGETTSYRFQLSQAADGTGSLVDSGWLSSPSWSPPPGALVDGGHYYGKVLTTGQNPTITPDQAGWSPPIAPTDIRTFAVKQRLGAGGPSPTDTVGTVPANSPSPSQGSPSPGTAPASVTVNLVTGNLAVDAGTQSVHALGGDANVKLHYNSAEASIASGSNYGLLGQYFLDSDNSHTFAGAPTGQRIDPGINFSNKLGTSPIGGIPSTEYRYLMRWTGRISLPAGTWTLGGITTGGMRIMVDGGPWIYDDWAGSAPHSYPATYGPTTIAGNTSYKITVEDWSGTQQPDFTTAVQLWAQNTQSSSAGVIVPVTWLSPTSAGVPAGWVLTPTAQAAMWSGVTDLGAQVVVRSATGLTSTFDRQPDGTYTAPPGDSNYLTRNGNGSLQLSTAGQELYVFNADGTLASVTNTVDDLHPTALQYGYAGNPALLRTITDPVSSRQVQVFYGGDSSCPTVNPAPPGFLCQVTTWDGASTTFGYNSNGQISIVNNPGGQRTSLAYDSDNKLTNILDPLAADYVAAGQPGIGSCDTAPTGSTCKLNTQVAYDASGRVSSVTSPQPVSGAGRPARNYTYMPQSTDVLISGQGTGASYSTEVTYDDKGRITTSKSWGLPATTAVWNSNDLPIVSVNPAGLQTSTVYDSLGNTTDTYGPAPTACFDPATWPAGSAASAPAFGYLPLASSATVSGCQVVVPHSVTSYDQGINGLAATYWSNGQFAGSATKHAGLASNNAPCQAAEQSSDPQTWLCVGWPTSSSPVAADSNGNWSLRLAGSINVATSGTHSLNLWARGASAIWLDGQLVTILGAPANSSQSVTATTQQNLAQGPHSILIQYVGTQGWDNFVSAKLDATPIPATALKPLYALATDKVDPDGIATHTAYSDATVGPELGLPTSTTRDPNGLALATVDTYEANNYHRLLTETLPSGNATTYAYYTGTAGPLAAVCGVGSSTPQNGQLKSRTDPRPASGQPGRVLQYVYDSAGRIAGTREGNQTTVGAAGWQCTSRDGRGRVSTETWPAWNGASARTVTYAYSVGGNPLRTSVSDTASASSTITTTVDFLGRLVSYQEGSNTATTTYDLAGRVLTSTGLNGSIGDIYLATGQIDKVSRTVNGVKTTLANVNYDAGGRISQILYANGVTSTVSYDAYGNRARLAVSGASGRLTTISSATYSPGSRITSVGIGASGTNPNPAGPNATDYQYDGAGRLVAAWMPGQQATYSYGANLAADNCIANKAGKDTNRTSVTTTPSGGGAAVTTRYCYDNADRITSSAVGTVSESRYAFDDHGNQTLVAGVTNGWDVADRLSQSTTTSNVTTTYQYDPVDRVASQTRGSATARYVYGGFTQAPAAALDSNGQVTEQFVSLPGGVSLRFRGAVGTWSYPDLQGNVTATADDGGFSLTSNLAYDPWGVQVAGGTPDNGSSVARMGAHGQDGKFTESSTGFVTLGARVFDPTTARFLSVDPVHGGCANPYAYAYGDPINTSDLSGNFCWKKWVGLGLGIVSAATAIATLGASLAVEGGTAALVLSVTSLVTGIGAATIDGQACLSNRESVACAGFGLAVAGVIVGMIALTAEVFTLTPIAAVLLGGASALFDSFTAYGNPFAYPVVNGQSTAPKSDC